MKHVYEHQARSPTLAIGYRRMTARYYYCPIKHSLHTSHCLFSKITLKVSFAFYPHVCEKAFVESKNLTSKRIRISSQNLVQKRFFELMYLEWIYHFVVF